MFTTLTLGLGDTDAAILALTPPERSADVFRHPYSWRDNVVYALGVGFGLDPLDEGQLRFVDETKLAAVPTMANVLAYPVFWMRDLDTGIDWVRVVHGEQTMQLHKPLASEGEIVGTTRIVDSWGWGIAGGAIDIQKVNIAADLVGRRFDQRK
jgi:hypothetical protein